jgi:hypothetical protein
MLQQNSDIQNEQSSEKQTSESLSLEELIALETDENKKQQLEQIYHEYKSEMQHLEMQQLRLLEEYERRIDDLKVKEIEDEIKNE